MFRALFILRFVDIKICVLYNFTMEKMRVAVFTDSYYPIIDGVVSVIDNYAARLTELGCDVTVFAPASRKRGYVDDKPYKVVRCKTFKLLWLEYDLPMPNSDISFKRYLKENVYDIVHIHSPFSIGKLGMEYAQKNHIPCVITMHSQFKRDFYRQTKSRLLTKYMLSTIMKVFNGCDYAWAVNQAVANVFKEYGYIKQPLVVTNASDMLPVPDLDTAKAHVNELYNIDSEANVFLFVGRLNLVKNLAFLLQAVKLYKQQNSNFKLIMAGSGQDDLRIRTLAKEYKLDDVIIFTGALTDRNLVAELFARADLFCFPSLYDCSSIVQIEAASQHTPTLFLKGAVTASTVTDNQNGYLSDNSPQAFADKMYEIISDKQKLQTISDNAFNELYVHWDTQMNHVLNLYKEAISEYKKSHAE